MTNQQFILLEQKVWVNSWPKSSTKLLLLISVTHKAVGVELLHEVLAQPLIELPLSLAWVYTDKGPGSGHALILFLFSLWPGKPEQGCPELRGAEKWASKKCPKKTDKKKRGKKAKYWSSGCYQQWTSYYNPAGVAKLRNEHGLINVTITTNIFGGFNLSGWLATGP